MDNREVGLIEKYEVTRVDGKPITNGCIVMEWADENARHGIKAFAKAVRENGYTKLADDIDGVLAAYGEPDDGFVQHDTKRTSEWMRALRERNGVAYPWDITLSLIERMVVTSKMTTRPHTFACGTEGEVVDELTVKFKFPKGELDIQPHTCFAKNSVDHFIQAFSECELEGWIENMEEQ